MMPKQTKLSYKTIAAFLVKDENKRSRIFGYIGLAIGVLLLLTAVQMYININQLLKEKNTRKNGFDFISVTKTITNANMGHDNRFKPEEVEELKQHATIADAAPLISNQFRVKASAGTIIPFSTELFLETLKDDFIDTVPPAFNWVPGQKEIPIIFSSDLLEMYNVFAPTQDLPQVSAETISSMTIILECYGLMGMEEYRGRIVALSDRINSIIVPEEFLVWANERYGNVTVAPPARVYIKTEDANNPQLLSFLESKDYHINKDKTRFGRLKQILEAVISGLGGFAVLVILLAMMLFSFYLQLVIARSKDNLQLLLTLGYSPGWLSKTVSGRWIPVYSIIIFSALAATAVLQFLFQQNVLNGRDEVSSIVSPVVIGVAVMLLAICVLVNYRLIRKLLYRL